jgi:hypothetical protein
VTSEEEIWVAKIDKKQVGFMILSPNQDGTLEIDWLDVNPEFQRRGSHPSGKKSRKNRQKQKVSSVKRPHTDKKYKNDYV